MDPCMKFQGVRSIARNAGQMIGARVIGPVLQAGYVALLAAYLGPELFGLLSYSRSWYLALLPLTLLGLGAILSREIGRDRAQAADIVARAFTLRVLATVLTALVCASLGWILETNLIVRALISIFSFALAARAICIFAEQVFVAFESSGYILRQEALFRPIEVCLGSIVIVLGGDVLGVALVHVTIWGLQAVRGLYLVQTRLVPVHFEWAWLPLGRMLREGIPIGLASIFSIWLMQGPLVLYRQVAVSEAALGLMALAIQILGLVSLLPLSIAGVAMPVLSRAVARADRKELVFLDGMCRLAVVLGTIAAITGTVGGPWFVKAVFGAGFAPAGHFIGPVLWLVIPLSIGHAMQLVLFARSLHTPAILAAATGALVLSGSLGPLVSQMGPLGLIIATAAGQTVWVLALLFAIGQADRIGISRALLRSTVATLCATAAYWILIPVGPWSSWIGSVTVLVGACFAFGVISTEERHTLIAMLRRGNSKGGRDASGMPPTDPAA